jgi:hypothetical protein
VERQDLLGRKRLGPLQQAPRPLVAAPDLVLLGVGERQDPKRQHFVHFRAVEQVPGALRRDRRGSPKG